MESAHLHQYHQQFQDHQLPPPILASSSSSLPNNNNTSSSPSSSYGVSTSCTTTWTPNTTLLSSGLYPNNNNILNSRNHHPHLNICNDSPMTQDLTFHHWANAAAAFDGGGGGAGQSIKQELSTIAAIDHHRHQQQHHHNQQRGLVEMDTIDAKLLLGTLSGAGHQPAAAAAHHQFYSDNNNNSNRGGRFSQIYPTISVPTLNQEASSLANSSSLGMNMQALDLFNSARLNASFGHTTSPDEHHQLGFHNYGFDHHHLHQPSQRSFGNVSSSSALLSNAICAEPKRPSNLVEPNPPQAPPKKSRLDSRASCPPFKVRKEKLGDRIAALQQLVAPFGKTDTASVLMEAIGYIKFLQNQVETLSVPYMKSSRNRSSSRAMHGGQEGNNNIGSEEVRRDLRSRGLCLVPLSCLSYVTDSGGGVWPPPNFGGS